MRAGILGRNLPICLRISDFHGGRVHNGSDIFFLVLEPKLIFSCLSGANDNSMGRSSALCQPHLHPYRLVLKVWGELL